MAKLAGKVAFITGAARGQGRAHALRLAGDGAAIIALDVCAPVSTNPAGAATSDDLAETVHQVTASGGEIVAVEADIRDVTALSDAVRQGVDRFGSLDIVCANAAIGQYGELMEITDEVWNQTIDVNLTGAWNTCRAAVPHIIAGGRGGSVVLINSLCGLKGMANTGAYNAAKHGTVGLMRTLANELAQHMIRVNSVHPTAVNTAMIHNPRTYSVFAPDLTDPTPEQIRDRISGLNALPVPWVEPEDIANAVAFLASDDARYITGVTLPVDAGAFVK